MTAAVHDVASGEESSGTEPPSCSLYMKELQAFIARAVDDYLAPFNCKQLVTARSGAAVAGGRHFCQADWPFMVVTNAR